MTNRTIDCAFGQDGTRIALSGPVSPFQWTPERVAEEWARLSDEDRAKFDDASEFGWSVWFSLPPTGSALDPWPNAAGRRGFEMPVHEAASDE